MSTQPFGLQQSCTSGLMSRIFSKCWQMRVLVFNILLYKYLHRYFNEKFAEMANQKTFKTGNHCLKFLPCIPSKPLSSPILVSDLDSPLQPQVFMKSYSYRLNQKWNEIYSEYVLRLLLGLYLS